MEIFRVRPSDGRKMVMGVPQESSIKCILSVLWEKPHLEHDH
ncbi:hypothetical protein JL2886_01123 [Phaeobacter gallaeciensis]|uniref:Uncharacterized protein n=1 Tax=Phaeobacter gallaeciensis TaxID=60890 RepID=A0A1B0ZPN7_9RHOB|nr:hypothetical protein JL2886_01123 [Phaeobacter gallaeciensis]